MSSNFDKKAILDKIFSKKGKDYSYAVGFFLIFSFFVFFVIRPNILSVFESNLKIQNLKKTNSLYEYQIQNIINAQTVLVDARDDLFLLDEALSSKPQVNQLIGDITKTAEKNNLTIGKMSLVDVNLKDITASDQLKTLTFNMELVGDFDNFLNLMKDIYNQRRVKILKNIAISQSEEVGTASGELKIELQLESYYL